MIGLLFPLILFASGFLSVGEIKPGMEGIGETVFEGTRIDTFKVKIIGVLKNVFPKSDIILAKLSGNPLEKTGLIDGMSGSPVYIDNKLIGALAYRMGVFSKEPIAGITPISDMLKITQKEERTSLKTSSTPNLTPIKIPLVICGADARLFNLDNLWKKLGGAPIQGGMPAFDTAFVPKPGAAIGVELVKGDLSIAAMGTLTYLDKDKVLAFGHPLFEIGKVEYPLCGGYVHSVLPSQLNSYKFISPLHTIGKVTQDYRGGIMGKIGEYAKMIPLNVSLNKHIYHFEVIDCPFLIPDLMAISLANCLYSEEGSPPTLTLQLDTKIGIKGYPEIEYRDLYSGEKAIEDLTSQFFKNLDSLINNPFKKVELHKVDVKIKALHREGRAKIIGLTAKKGKVLLSEPLKLTVSLQLRGGERLTKEVSLNIPTQGLKGRELMVVATSGDSAFVFDRKEVFNIEQFLIQFRRRPAKNELVIMVFSQDRELRIEGKNLPSLPPSISALLSHREPSLRFSLSENTLISKKVISTPYTLSGRAVLRIKVEE